MKQLRRALAGLALAAALLTGSVFAAVPAAPEGSCVLDEANVLSERTEQTVNDLTIALDEACGAQIGVLTVEFTGDATTADFAVDTFNAWGVGDADKDNGVLLLLVTGAEDYYCAVGTGLEKDLTPQKIDDLLWNNLEEGFAKARPKRKPNWLMPKPRSRMPKQNSTTSKQGNGMSGTGAAT